MGMSRNGRASSELRQFALAVSFGYIALAVAWIGASDKVLEAMVPNVANLTILQTLKGFFFVGFTGVLLYLVILRRPLEQLPNSVEAHADDRRIRVIVASAIAILVSVVLANAIYTVMEQRRQILRDTELTAQSMTRVIEEQAHGSLNSVDVTLASIARAMQYLPGRKRPHDPDINALLRGDVRNLPFVRAIWILDANGNMIHDSDNLPGHYNLSGRDYFRVQRDDPSLGMFVAPPIVNPLGVWFMGTSRRINNPDGSFAGVVAAAVEPRYFEQFYASIKVGKSGILSLLRPDGMMIARSPAASALVGKVITPLPKFVGLLPKADSGSYRSISSVDGTERVYAYRKVPSWPIVALVGLGEEESLAAWRGTALAIGFAAFAFICLIGWLGYLILRELDRRSVFNKTLREAQLSLESSNRELGFSNSQLKRAAHYDALTGLPNRVLLADRLQQAMNNSLRRNQSLAVAYLDLDGFKVVNDKHGHNVGDQLLIAIAQRMSEALRDGDTLARIGGDEFVAVFVDLERTQDCEPILERLLHACVEPVQIGNAALQISASIGVTVYPQDGADSEQLMRHADQAMYQAKQAGKNRYLLFDVAHYVAIKKQHESLDDIRQALERREFVLYYQPKVNMKTGQVFGAEALIRWQHPERGLLPPAAFLPIIEDHEISVQLGEWVIETALTQLSLWHDAGLDITVSVNISARQLQQSDFAARLFEQLAAHPAVPHHRLELEILETSALEDIAQISSIMHACQGVGVRFALDDFGTGYSSLTYLKRLPAELLKIDQSFVRDMLEDPDDLAIIKGVIGLAAAFHRQVIAEGVETIAHGVSLLSLGCELAQGYGIARPMPADELLHWVATWRPDASWRNHVGRDGHNDLMAVSLNPVL
jgi:diguanylate cyclase (GGDEF)-like protein